MPNFSQQFNKIKDLHINNLQQSPVGSPIQQLIDQKKESIEKQLDNKQKFGQLVQKDTFKQLLSILDNIDKRLDIIQKNVAPLKITNKHIKTVQV